MFAMPDLANSECATSDWGFPEFQIVIRAEGEAEAASYNKFRSPFLECTVCCRFFFLL